MSLAKISQQVTDDQLSRYADLIYDRTGIRISPQKKTLLSNRLRRRLRATGIDCYDEYLSELRRLPQNDPEWDAFLQEITTHETYLFRDAANWDWLRGTYLPELQAAARKGQRTKSLRIWSAACSTGDEACTIACCVADALSVPGEWKVEIVGTDIGVDAVQQATDAEFGERAMRLVPDSYRRRYFAAQGDNTWKAKPNLTQWMKFRQHNLLDRLAVPPFDLIILKNVLIYFDKDSKKRVVDNLHRALRPGGMLITGPAEGVSDMLGDYERVHPWLHRKT